MEKMVERFCKVLKEMNIRHRKQFDFTDIKMRQMCVCVCVYVCVCVCA